MEKKEDNLVDLIIEIQALAAASEGDGEKVLNKKNKAAGIRLRKSMQKIKNLCQEVRDDVQTITKD